MNSIVKIYLGIWLMLCMTALSMGILTAFISVVHVENLFNHVIEQLSFNDLDAEIIKDTMNELAEEGLQSRYTLYDENGEIGSYTEPNLQLSDIVNIDHIKVEIQYSYGIGEWSSGKVLKLAGYAW